MKRFGFFFAVFITFIACDDSPSGEPCVLLGKKLQSCGLMTKGEIYCDSHEDTAYDDCVSNCIARASCDLLESFLCEGVREPAILACYYDCPSEPLTFTCDDGYVISNYEVCDASEDCPDGSDEFGCSVFTCENGEKIPLNEQCDGKQDCLAGSDELGCPMFTCDNGQEVRLNKECDGTPDCDDGSDEMGCPDYAEPTCPE